MGIVKNEGNLVRVEAPVKNGDIITVTYYLSHAPNASFTQHFMPDGIETMEVVLEQANSFYKMMRLSMENTIGWFEPRSLRGMLSRAGVYNI